MEAAEYELMDAAEASMWWYRALHRRVETAIQDFLPRPGRVLDAGCGTGGLAVRLAKRFPQHRLIAVDLHLDACQRAARKSALPVVAASVDALPFAHAVFDAILSMDVLCCAGVDQARALTNAHDLLKPGGILLLNVPAFRWLMSDHDARVHTARRYDRDEVRRLLAAHGFRPLRVSYWNSVLFPLMVLRRKVFRPSNGESDVRAYPKLLDGLFSAALLLEQQLAKMGAALPFGGSVMAIAVKPDA